MTIKEILGFTAQLCADIGTYKLTRQQICQTLGNWATEQENTVRPRNDKQPTSNEHYLNNERIMLDLISHYLKAIDNKFHIGVSTMAYNIDQDMIDNHDWGNDNV